MSIESFKIFLNPHSSMTIDVERVKGNNNYCRTCKGALNKGAVRIAVRVKVNEYRNTLESQVAYYHQDCYKENQKHIEKVFSEAYQAATKTYPEMDDYSHLKPAGSKFKKEKEAERKSRVKMEKDIEEADVILDKQVLKRAEFSHNICSCVLRDIANKHGVEVANHLVEKHNLELVFGIPKVETDDNK